MDNAKLVEEMLAMAAKLTSIAQELMGFDPEANPETYRFLDTALGELISCRASNALMASNVYTVRDLVRSDIRDLRKMPNLGEKSLEEIWVMLRGHGLYLGMSVPARAAK